uniref:Uncharacterized protein n=1 Tax=Arundo donax TaxID=35708 RepID=A0A0A9FFH2_ARUDO
MISYPFQQFHLNSHINIMCRMLRHDILFSSKIMSLPNFLEEKPTSLSIPYYLSILITYI